MKVFDFGFALSTGSIVVSSGEKLGYLARLTGYKPSEQWDLERTFLVPDFDVDGVRTFETAGMPDGVFEVKCCSDPEGLRGYFELRDGQIHVLQNKDAVILAIGGLGFVAAEKAAVLAQLRQQNDWLTSVKASQAPAPEVNVKIKSCGARIREFQGKLNRLARTQQRLQTAARASIH